MSAKKSPEELGADVFDRINTTRCKEGPKTIASGPEIERIKYFFILGFEDGFEAGQANPTPDAIEKLMPSDAESEKARWKYLMEFVRGDKAPTTWDECRGWITSELKRRAGGER